MQLHNHRGFVELAMPNDLETSPPVSPALFETIPPTGLPSTERPIFSGPTESFAREFQWISWWNLKHIIATWCKNRPLRESRICPFLPYFRSTSIDSHAEIFWNIWQIWWGSKHKGQTSEVTPGMSSGRKMRSRAWAEARMGQQGNTMIVTDLKKPWLCSTEFAQLGSIHCPCFSDHSTCIASTRWWATWHYILLRSVCFGRIRWNFGPNFTVAESGNCVQCNYDHNVTN